MVKALHKTKTKNGAANILIPSCLHSNSLSYRKLSSQRLLKLSVLKLDGSYFCVHVMRNATVAGLKSATEDECNISPRDEMKILWSLVWSHFCLSYEGQKLISEKACIRKYGIKDGDQLQFIQHLRTDLAPTPRQSKNQNVESQQSSVTNARDARVKHHCISIEDHGDDHLAFLVSKSNRTHSFKDWLSRSRFQRWK